MIKHPIIHIQWMTMEWGVEKYLSIHLQNSYPRSEIQITHIQEETASLVLHRHEHCQFMDQQIVPIRRCRNPDMILFLEP